jgi:hypothetical protein
LITLDQLKSAMPISQVPNWKKLKTSQMENRFNLWNCCRTFK